MISLPASDTAGSPHTQADDVEVGGMRGREALDRLRNVIGRVESSWRPASAEEGFEIVRRRLFEPMVDPAQFEDRDVVARAFADLYRSQHQEFPPECRDSDYEKRLQAAYPIHPEIFDRLYNDWSTLVKFQRTRGVLRLMAAVIHRFGRRATATPLILPSTIPIDDPRVQFELTRYLSDNWVPVIEKDVDGPNSLPLRIDGEVPNLGKLHACRRVARAIYLGSRPRPKPPIAASRTGASSSAASCPASRPPCLAMRCGARRQRRPISIRTARATGTPRKRPSPSSPRIAPSSSSANPTRWLKSWNISFARTFARLGNSAAFTSFRTRAATCPTTMMSGWSCWRRSKVIAGISEQRRRAGGEGDFGIARQRAAPVPQHAGVSRGRQSPLSGFGRSAPQVPRLGFDRRGEGDPQPRPLPGKAS